MTDIIKTSDENASNLGLALTSHNLLKDAQGQALIGTLPALSRADEGYLDIPPIPGYSSTAASPHLSGAASAGAQGGPDLAKLPAGESPNLGQELAPNWLRKELFLHQGIAENPPIGLPVDPKTGLIVVPTEPIHWHGRMSNLPPLPENPYAYIEQHPWMKQHHGEGDSPAEILLMMYQAEHTTPSYYSPSEAPPPPDIIWKAPKGWPNGNQFIIPKQEIMD